MKDVVVFKGERYLDRAFEFFNHVHKVANDNLGADHEGRVEVGDKIVQDRRVVFTIARDDVLHFVEDGALRDECVAQVVCVQLVFGDVDVDGLFLHVQDQHVIIDFLRVVGDVWNIIHENGRELQCAIIDGDVISVDVRNRDRRAVFTGRFFDQDLVLRITIVVDSVFDVVEPDCRHYRVKYCLTKYLNKFNFFYTIPKRRIALRLKNDYI